MIRMSKKPTFTEQIRRLIETSGETRYRIAVRLGRLGMASVPSCAKMLTFKQLEYLGK